MNRLIILSIIYHEPEWQQTKQCIEATGLPVHYVERKPKGVGSLSEAINRGIKEIEGYEYVWIVTNITFPPATPEKLLSAGYDAIHPAFNSDHAHQRPDGTEAVKDVPFIEFTSAMVKMDIMKRFPLDEAMPYWGMDLDFSYRLHVSGYKVGVHMGATIGHTYIRNKKLLPVTYQRLLKRRQTNHQTKRRLKEKYGQAWRSVVFPKTEQDIGRFYEQVKQVIG